MNKEYLEALERLYCSGNLQLDYVLSDNHKQDYESIEQAIQRLESIDNSNPSEALKALKELRVIANTYCSFNGTQCEHNKELADIIEKALLKVQEPKHYLKWEDLVFTRDEKVMLVKMGDTIYKIECVYYDNVKEVKLLSEDEKRYYLGFTGNYKDNVQLFNDLHLEVIE